MIFSKLRTMPGMAFAFAVALALGSQTAPALSQDQEQQAPAAGGEQAAPPAEGAGESAAPAAEPAQDGAAAPSAEPSQETGGAPAEAPAGEGSAAAPASPEAPAAAAAPAGGGGIAINASQIQIGAAVFGTDGAKIGEVNGVKSDDSGKVQEILVTDGMPAGINAKVFEVPADKIASVTDGVKLSLSSEEAKQLPVIDNSKG